jgi:hypothetical protein
MESGRAAALEAQVLALQHRVQKLEAVLEGIRVAVAHR